MKNLKFKFTIQKIIGALVVWQVFSVALMAVGTWPAKVAIINTALLALFILFVKPYYSVLLLILSIPLYIAIPNRFIADLPMWRLLFAWLFVVWLAHVIAAQRLWLLRVSAFKRWYSETPLTGAKFREILINAYKRIDSRFMPWDKVAVLFIVLAFLSLLIARFPMHGFKQILFLLNVYAFYIVIINVTTDATKLKELIRYTTYSLGIVVGLGFVQYLGTMFAQPYYFWQYWATMVSGLYYGIPLANVLVYSNSWFSYSGGAQALRMFGILPDTHAFGVICIFLLAYLNSHIQLQGQWKSTWTTLKQYRWYLLVAIFLTSFGVMANGTRGIWLAMLVPMVIVLFMYWRILQSFTKPWLVTYSLIVVLFLISPFISQGLNLIRTYDVKDNFLSRAGSIYDLSESSNVGRLEIWQHSLRFAAVHPFGVGYGNFITSVVSRIPEKSTYEQISAKKNLRFNLPEKFITAHSLYLQLVVELGFAGLLVFGLFWWEYFERLVQFFRKHGQVFNRYNSLALSLALAFIWILAYGLFDVTILNDRVLQYLFISLAISGLIFAKYDSLLPVSEQPEENNDIMIEN